MAAKKIRKWEPGTKNHYLRTDIKAIQGQIAPDPMHHLKPAIRLISFLTDIKEAKRIQSRQQFRAWQTVFILTIRAKYRYGNASAKVQNTDADGNREFFDFN